MVLSLAVVLTAMESMIYYLLKYKNRHTHCDVWRKENFTTVTSEKAINPSASGMEPTVHLTQRNLALRQMVKES